ncbi:MAG: GntR family transcriptional regulator [Victivallales bacterium]|nr:GntR family transcriptional regulator [Victivallales bacterium]
MNINKYEEIADVLRQEIRALPEGGKLPSIRELKERHNASQATIDRSLAMLEAQGEVIRRPNSGYFRVCWEGRQRRKLLLFCFFYHKEQLQNPLYGPMLLELIRQAAMHNYELSPLAYDESGNVEVLLQRIHSLDPAGCLFLGCSETASEQFKTHLQLPVVHLYPNFPLEECAECAVDTDNKQVMHLLMDHLCTLGHERIALIHGQSFDGTYMTHQEERIDAFLHELTARGLPVTSRYIVYGGFNVDCGYEGAMPLLSQPPKRRPTAIIANDYNAAGVYQAAHELGLRIPGDLSVVGIDNLPGDQGMLPRLTSIDICWKNAVATALKMVATENPTPKLARIPGELFVRNSTGRNIQ